MSYSESAEGVTICYARAILELRKHGAGSAESVEEFHRDCGVRDFYEASAVLAWLGY